jgi:putative aldouronate transport system permease protein
VFRFGSSGAKPAGASGSISISGVPTALRRNRKSLTARVWAVSPLYLFLLPAVLYVVVFNYWPMYGLQIAFKDFRSGLGILGSPWVGLTHFDRFFRSYMFPVLIRNTLLLSGYQILAGFPVPIILSIAIHYAARRGLRRFTQTVTYAPYFISQVVLVGMLLLLLSPRTGVVNVLVRALGGTPVFFMGKEELFRHIYVWSGIWQNSGWASIIYLAVLSNSDPDLHEAAIIDGATKPQRVRHIDIPVLIPTAAILLVMNTGRLLAIGFEKGFFAD